MRAPLDVRRTGSGPPVVLVHGGVGRELTWERQQPLAERWTLIVPARRGFDPSPPAERQDFLVDADDLGKIVSAEGSAHLVGFSYGTLGATLVACENPGLVRSLTLIEPPLFSFARDRPAARELERLAAVALSGERSAEDADRDALAAAAGLDAPGVREERDRAARLARGMRLPGEAHPELSALVDAGIPCLIVSGDHQPGIEAASDAVAGLLGADRLRVPDAGHAVQRRSGFNERLERFLAGSEGDHGAR